MKNNKLALLALITLCNSSLFSYAADCFNIKALQTAYVNQKNKTIVVDIINNEIDFGFGYSTIKSCNFIKGNALITSELPPEQGGDSLISIDLRANDTTPSAQREKNGWIEYPSYPVIYTIHSVDNKVIESGSMLRTYPFGNADVKSIIKRQAINLVSITPNDKEISSAGGWDPLSQANTSQNTKVLSNNYTTEYTYPNGDKFSGVIENGLPNGVGTIFYTNGDRYDGEVYKAIRSGKGTIKYANGDTFEGDFRNGEKNMALSYSQNGDNFYKSSPPKTPPQNQSTAPTQTTSSTGNALGNLINGIVQGIVGYQDGKNSARRSQSPVIITAPQPTAAVYHEGNFSLPVRPLTPLTLPPLPSPQPIYIPSKEPVTGKISGD